MSFFKDAERYDFDVTSELTAVDLVTEISAICAWARSNKMTINMSKTKELVFHRPNPRHFIYPTPLDNIERVTECKLLELCLSLTILNLTAMLNLSLVNVASVSMR